MHLSALYIDTKMVRMNGDHSKLEYWVRIEYPTGRNHSLELMFAKLATAKNREKFKPFKTYLQQMLVS